MLDFKEEINKFKPIMCLDEVENAIRSDEVRDVMELLQYLTKQISTAKE